MVQRSRKQSDPTITILYEYPSLLKDMSDELLTDYLDINDELRNFRETDFDDVAEIEQKQRESKYATLTEQQILNQIEDIQTTTIGIVFEIVRSCDRAIKVMDSPKLYNENLEELHANGIKTLPLEITEFLLLSHTNENIRQFGIDLQTFSTMEEI